MFNPYNLILVLISISSNSSATLCVVLRISWQCFYGLFIVRQKLEKLRNGFAQVQTIDRSRGAGCVGKVTTNYTAGRYTYMSIIGSSCSRLKVERIFHCVVVAFIFFPIFTGLACSPKLLPALSLSVSVSLWGCCYKLRIWWSVNERKTLLQSLNDVASRHMPFVSVRYFCVSDLCMRKKAEQPSQSQNSNNYIANYYVY